MMSNQRPLLDIKTDSSSLQVTVCNFTSLLRVIACNPYKCHKMNFHVSYEYGNQSINQKCISEPLWKYI